MGRVCYGPRCPGTVVRHVNSFPFPDSKLEIFLNYCFIFISLNAQQANICQQPESGKPSMLDWWWWVG